MAKQEQDTNNGELKAEIRELKEAVEKLKPKSEKDNWDKWDVTAKIIGSVAGVLIGIAGFRYTQLQYEIDKKEDLQNIINSQKENLKSKLVDDQEFAVLQVAQITSEEIIRRMLIVKFYSLFCSFVHFE